MKCPKCAAALAEVETTDSSYQKHFRCGGCGRTYAWHEDCRNIRDRGLHACWVPELHVRVKK